MPALTGEPWRGRARLEVNEGISQGRYWVSTNAGGDLQGSVANSDEWDRLPGDALTLTFGALQPTGLGMPNPFETVIVQTVIPGTTTVVGSSWTFPIANNTSGSQLAQRTFHFDDDPLNTVLSGAIRAGMLEILLTMRRSGQATNNHDINSRGEVTGTLPAGRTHNHARGYVRSRFRLAVVPTVTRATAGQEPPPFAYRDATRTRWTPQEVPYAAYSTRLDHINPANSSVIRSGTGPAVATNFERVHEFVNTGVSRLGSSSIVDKDYPAAFSVDIGLPTTTFGGTNDSQFAWATTNQPAGWAPTNALAQTLRNTSLTFAAAPELTFTQHLQEDANSYATPPASIRETSNQMLSTVLGYVGARVRNSRGEGVNYSNSGGISYSFRDIKNLTAASLVTNQPTVSGGGEAGWGPLLAWSASKPGGTWRNVVTFTDEAGVQATANHDYAMLASDPRIALAVGGGSPVNDADHFTPGDNLVVAMSLFFGKTKGKIAPDADTAECAITRLNLATGTAQHLDSDGTWKDMGAGAAHFWPLTASPTDPAVMRRIFGQGAVHTQVDTSTWGTFDIVLIGQAKVNGTPYARVGTVTVLGTANRHSRYEFDLIGKM